MTIQDIYAQIMILETECKALDPTLHVVEEETATGETEITYRGTIQTETTQSRFGVGFRVSGLPEQDAEARLALLTQIRDRLVEVKS